MNATVLDCNELREALIGHGNTEMKDIMSCDYVVSDSEI
jgi:hypothetical protein